MIDDEADDIPFRETSRSCPVDGVYVNIIPFLRSVARVFENRINYFQV